MNGTSGNSSNWNSTDNGMEYYWRNTLKVVLSVEVIYMVVGLGLNVWFLTVVLKNKDLRHRLRNQLISSMLAMHIVFTLTAPIVIYIVARFLNRNFLSCQVYTTSQVLGIIFSFISEWTLVIIIAVFLAHMLGFDLSTKLTPMFTTIGRYALLLFPWLLGILLSPSIIYHYHKKIAPVVNGCFYITPEAYRLFEMLNTVLPGAVCLVCLVLAEVFRRRRLSRGFYSRDVDMEEGLTYKNLDNDKTLTYVVAFILSLALDVSTTVVLYTPTNFSSKDYITVMVACTLLRDARAIVMPLPWLLFPDIRQAVMFWRKPQISSEDLNAFNVAYSKEG